MAYLCHKLNTKLFRTLLPERLLACLFLTRRSLLFLASPKNRGCLFSPATPFSLKCSCIFRQVNTSSQPSTSVLPQFHRWLPVLFLVSRVSTSVIQLSVVQVFMSTISPFLLSVDYRPLEGPVSCTDRLSFRWCPRLQTGGIPFVISAADFYPIYWFSPVDSLCASGILILLPHVAL